MLRVTAVTASSEHSEGCSTTAETRSFTARLNFNVGHPAGTVKYRWERSDGASGPTKTAPVPVGPTSLDISTTWNLGGPSLPDGDYWEKVVVFEPNSTSSGKATISLSAMICYAN